MLAAALIMLTSISIDDLRQEFRIAPRDAGIVRDAISKWSMRDRPADRSMKNRFPIVLHLPHQRCVVLWLRIPSVGLSPSYCYELKNDHFLEASDQGE